MVKMTHGNGKFKKNLSAIHWNMGAKSWERKSLEIEAVIQEYKPDLFAISEANMKLSLTVQEKNIQGYSMILPRTTEVQNHARLVLLVKEGLEVQLLPDLMDTTVAAIWIKICSRGRKSVTVGFVYREHQFIWQDQPNDSSTLQNQILRWNMFVEKWKQAARGADVILLGDLNLDYVKWAQPDNAHVKMVDKVKTEIETIGFNQMVADITRTWPGVPDSNIDHCWINTPWRFSSYKNLARAYSDHNLILIIFHMKYKQNNIHNFTKRDRKEFDVEQYKRDIAGINWEEFNNCNNLEVLNDIFENKILDILNVAAPLKTSQRRKHHRNWVTVPMKEEMSLRDKLRQKARDSGKQEDWAAYRIARNKCIKSLKKCKQEHFENLFSKMEQEKTTKGLYNLTRELCDLKDGSSPQCYQKDGKMIRKPCDMADLQLNYYTEKISTLQSKIPVSNRNPHRFLDCALANWADKDERAVFNFREITIMETSQLISSLAGSTALGHDEIDSLAIKSAAQHLINPLRKIINMSLSEGKFIQKWIFARVTPRLKSHDMDTTSTSSYRPVAVLTVTSKLVERAVQLQLLDYMEKSGQMNPSGHAYRKHYSTTTTLMEILDEIHQGTEEKKMSSMMAIDMSIAFDSVEHQRLLQKLKRYNLGSQALKWVTSYLNYRTQYVVVGTSKSKMDHITTGVPQGSVIGPLLFAIYTNDMSLAIRRPGCTGLAHEGTATLFGSQCSDCGILSTFADDSTYTTTSRSRQENQISLRRSLDELECYLNDNMLVINLSKTSLTECMIPQKKGRTPGPPPSLQVVGENGGYKTVADTDFTRILGANLQANLTWVRHLETGKKAVLPAARKQLGLLKHQGKLIPRSSRLTLARGLVLSKLTYIMPLWGGAAPAHLRKVQVLINAAARWATGLPRRTRISTLMQKAGWLSVYEQIRMSTLVQAWKLVHLGIPARPLERLSITQDLEMEVQPPRLQFSNDCWRWRAAREWNRTPEELRHCLTIASFKRHIKKMILTQRPREPD